MADTTGVREQTWAARAGRWFFPAVPAARVAVFRVFVYLFIIFDLFFGVNDVIGHSYAPDLAQPLLLTRVLHLPGPSLALAYTLQWTIIVGCLVAASGWLPRLAGTVVAVAFTWWMLDSQGFGYVQHDHMALVIATWVLPTAGLARFTDTHRTRAGGWALQVVAIAVVATYFGSAISKWVRSGSPIAWANSAVFVWAIMRRGSGFIRWTLEYPWLLVIGQWALLTAEFLAPVALWLKGRWLSLTVAFFFGFHLMTYLSLGIHFLPTVVCWLALLPLEKLLPRHRAAARVSVAARPEPA